MAFGGQVEQEWIDFNRNMEIFNIQELKRWTNIDYIETKIYI